ncbi:MAG: hypothetical protein IRZ07_10625, partial [Microbispora sp.]|nr:hypothetical protein [Microbispora sp.]
MAKLDGMDPKLVRELLSEIQHAASQMGGIEAQITQLTRTAGVSVQVTYRPSQIADSCTSMVKDVTKRVALLEKKEKQQGTGKVPTGKAPTASSASYSEEPDITVLPDDSAPSKPGAHDGKDGTKPDHKADHKTGEHTADAKADGHKTDGKAEHKPDANGDGKADAK